MSGVLRRTQLFSERKNGIVDAGYRLCVTGIGNMVEPSPFASRLIGSSDVYDQEWDDMIGHIDDIGWIEYEDRNTLSGTVSDVAGSANGWWMGGQHVLYGNTP